MREICFVLTVCVSAHASIQRNRFYIYFNVRNIYKHAHKSVSHTQFFFVTFSKNSEMSDKWSAAKSNYSFLKSKL